MANRTPGKWFYRPQEYDDWGTIRDSAGVPVANTCMSARIPKNFEYSGVSTAEERAAGPPEIQANAEFICRASRCFEELLAACKAVVDEDGFRGSGMMRKRVDAMREAIRKAEAP